MADIEKYKKCICILRKYCKKSKNVQVLQSRDVNVQNAESVAIPSRSVSVDEQLLQEVETFNVRLFKIFVNEMFTKVKHLRGTPESMYFKWRVALFPV